MKTSIFVYKIIDLNRGDILKSEHNEKNIISFFSIGVGIFITVLTIVILFTINTQHVKNNVIDKIANSNVLTNVYLLILGQEIPNFKDFLDSQLEMPSVQKLALESITGINNNISSLIIQELPGIGSSEIYIAGEGSDYPNFPQESPPPDFDELLKTGNSETDKQTKSNNRTSLQDPNVFIYQSHSWEAYIPLIEEHGNSGDASSIDNKENVVLVGSMLTKKLEEYGVNVLHDQTNMAQVLKDKGWNYNHSYELSRQYVETAATQNESINYYIDIHRDSAGKESTTVAINGKDYARLYFVVGKEHENYESNLRFVKKFHKKLEEKYPGISKGVYLKTYSEGNGVYNQDISNKSLLVEFGGIENKKTELTNTVNAFVDVFMDQYDGTIQVNATTH